MRTERFSDNRRGNMIKNQWYAVLPSKAVPEGKVIGARRLGQNLALFRDKEGNVGCVADKCTHRGAALSIGKVVNGCLQCPFHGLQFDVNGKCTFVPADGRAATADQSRFNVKNLPVREHCGIIYVWYGDEKNMTEDVPFFDDEIDGTWAYSELEDHWNSHYSRCIENQLDVVHLPFVHRTTIGRGNKTVVNGPKIEFIPAGLITSADNSVDEGQSPKPASECEIKKTYLKFLFPNIWLNHISDKMKVMIYFAPVDAENTILYIRFYSKVAGAKPIDHIVAQLGKAGNKIIERQDKRVVITQQPKASTLMSGENLLAGDRPIIEYRQIREELKKR